MAISAPTKQRLFTILDLLPDHLLNETLTFVEYLQYKQNHLAESTPFKPVALGGLWKDVSITDEDITQMRQEMWGTFGELEE